jgi:predicted  nucleic acid-binding Zn-ribbon protein
MDQSQALYKLQEIDLAIQQHEKRLDEIHEQLADNAAVQAAQAQVKAAEDTLKPLQANMKDIDLQIKSTQQKRERTEQRMYSGNVKNPKELQDMQQEITSLKKWTRELEDRLLEAMVAVEEAEAVLDTAQSNLRDVTDSAAAENDDLLNEKQQLEDELDDLNAKRPQAVERIDAENLGLYNKLRPKKGNRPLARLKADATCAACGVRQNAVIAKQVQQGADLVRCSNCGRILVAL